MTKHANDCDAAPPAEPLTDTPATVFRLQPVRRPTLHFHAVSSSSGLSGLAQLQRDSASPVEPHRGGPRRVVYLSRHGESMANVEGKIGGNTGLSPQGRLYAKKLPDLVHHILASKRSPQNLHIWTSSLVRTNETASFFDPARVKGRRAWKELDEIDAGICDMMTYEEVEAKFPEDAHLRDRDKFNFRYRGGGESYADVSRRIRPVMDELEAWFGAPAHADATLLVISHQAVLRCVLAHLMGTYKEEEVPYVKVPLHTLIRIEWVRGEGILREEKYHIDVPAVDAHKPHTPNQPVALPPPLATLPAVLEEEAPARPAPADEDAAPAEPDAPASENEDETEDAELVEVEIVSSDDRRDHAGLAAADLGLVVPAAADVSERVRTASSVEVGLGGKGYLSGDSH